MKLVLILIVAADLADVRQELQNRTLRRACHATGSANRVAFDKATDDLGAAFGAQLVHR